LADIPAHAVRGGKGESFPVLEAKVRKKAAVAGGLQ
jgi:hypothetical protein